MSADTKLTVPVAWDRLIVLKVPELAGLQDRVASPTGIRDKVQVEILRDCGLRRGRGC